MSDHTEIPKIPGGVEAGAPPADGDTTGPLPDRYKWVALSNTTLGMFMATVDASIVIISMPAIFRGIRLDPFAAGNISYLLWMIMGYMMARARRRVRPSAARRPRRRARPWDVGRAVTDRASG